MSELVIGQIASNALKFNVNNSFRSLFLNLIQQTSERFDPEKRKELFNTFCASIIKKGCLTPGSSTSTPFYTNDGQQIEVWITRSEPNTWDKIGAWFTGSKARFRQALLPQLLV